MEKIYRIFVLCIGLLACTTAVKGQDLAREKGKELIQKIEKEYPNIHGEVEEYFNGFPHSPMADHIRFAYASYCFNRGNYSAASQQLELTDPRSLSHPQQQEYAQNHGSCTNHSCIAVCFGSIKNTFF